MLFFLDNFNLPYTYSCLFPKKIMLSFKVNRRIESSNTIIGPRPEKLVKVEQTMGYRGKYGKNSNCLWVLTEA